MFSSGGAAGDLPGTQGRPEHVMKNRVGGCWVGLLSSVTRVSEGESGRSDEEEEEGDERGEKGVREHYFCIVKCGCCLSVTFQHAPSSVFNP